MKRLQRTEKEKRGEPVVELEHLVVDFHTAGSLAPHHLDDVSQQTGQRHGSASISRTVRPGTHLQNTENTIRGGDGGIRGQKRRWENRELATRG